MGPNLAKKIEVHADATFKSYFQGDYVESMTLSPTYKKEVEGVIKNMDPRKSCGYNGILPGVVKYLATELSVPLAYIINLTFLTGNTLLTHFQGYNT